MVRNWLLAAALVLGVLAVSQWQGGLSSVAALHRNFAALGGTAVRLDSLDRLILSLLL